MKKIFIDCRTLSEHSGIGRYIKSLLNEIYKISEDTFFYLGGNEKVISDYVVNNGWNKDSYKVISLSSKLYSIKEHLELAFKIPKVDIYWSPHISTTILGTRAKHRIVSIHDLYHFEFYKELSFLQRLYVKSIFKPSLNKADMIFTLSAFTTSQVQRFLSVRNIHKVFCGVEHLMRINMGKSTFSKNVASKYGIDNEYFVFLGNVKPHKNLVRSVEAYRLLCEKSKDIPDFVIIGKKDGYIRGDSRIFELVEHDEMLKKRVKFTGFVDDLDLPYLFHFAKALIFPSLHEGFGLPATEAMAFDCPVITSNLTSLPETCGDAAIYVDPYNIEEIANAIEKVLTDDKLTKDLIKKGYENIKRFSWKESAKKIYNLIQTFDEKK